MLILNDKYFQILRTKHRPIGLYTRKPVAKRRSVVLG